MPDQDAFRALTLAGPRRHSLAVWIWSALLVADAVLATRRLSGQFTEPLPAPLAIFSSLIVAITSLAAWSLYTSIPRPQTTKMLSVAPHAISLMITAIWCWALSVATSPLAAGMLFSIVLLQLGVLAASSDLAWSEGPPQVSHPEPPSMSAMPTPATTPIAEPTFSVKSDNAFVEETEFTDEGAGDVDEGQTLWLSRRTTDETEQVEGWVRVEFAAGQREAMIHVAFCPPLPGIPEIETEDLEGSDLEIRVAAAFAFGARLSVRRSGPLDEANTDRVGFFAQARAANRAA
ncbi:MAG: hypothetical protein JWP89_1680 [Schlesneria sp.]|nr:hypothetical protein [Schlesneria sp.]